MITRISMQNFKAHVKLELEHLPLVCVLVGRNNTGKSAVLHAAAMVKYGTGFGPAVPIGEARHLVHGGAADGRVELTFDDPTVMWAARFNRQSGYSPGWTGALGGKDLNKPSGSVFYLSAIRQPVTQFNYTQFVRDVGPQGEQTWNIIHQLKAMDDPRFVTILDWAKRFGLGVTALGTPTVNPGWGEIAPESYGHRTNLVLHGSGTWSVLPIITQGVLCEKDETLLIEEPEIHLHRESIDTLWEFLGDCAKRGVQTLCATHSIDFLASMHARIEEGIIPKDSVMYLLKRGRDGTTSAEKKDPAVFRTIRETIKKELAGDGL